MSTLPLRFQCREVENAQIINRPDHLVSICLFLYTFARMFAKRVTLKKLSAATLSVCLLGLLLGCVAICAHHIEDSMTSDAHSLSAPCDDEDCPITASVSATLPERSFISAGFDEGVSQYQPYFRVTIVSSGSARRLLFPSSLDPPFERLCVLRI
jgi:hypothetical protein